MKDRPLISPFNWALIALVVLATITSFVLVPLDMSLPIHWGVTGEADGFAPAPVALAFPLGMLVVVLAAMFLMRKARLDKDFAAGRFVIDATVGGVAGLMLALSIATCLIGLGHQLDMPRIVMLAVSVLLVLIGNALPKSQQNFVAGIRLPWTLRDADNWRITHRWTGRAMVVCGLIAFVVAVIGAPPEVLFTAIMAAAIVPVLIGTGVSYAHALKNEKT